MLTVESNKRCIKKRQTIQYIGKCVKNIEAAADKNELSTSSSRLCAAFELLCRKRINPQQIACCSKKVEALTHQVCKLTHYHELPVYQA